ncbi:MAG: 2OG-Fe(II) oxygenase [Pseudomonadota bacterium]
MTRGQRLSSGDPEEAAKAVQEPVFLLSVNPLVAVTDSFLAPKHCAGLIELGRGRLARAQVGSDTRALEVSASRSNSDAYLPPSQLPEVAALMERMAAVVAMPVLHGEGLSVLHYAPGQEFKPHVDGIWSGAGDAARAEFDGDGGQRLFTAILYLNGVDGGGATVFPKLGLRVPPEPGRLLVFANTEAGSSDATPRAMHAGEPVTAGEKWVAVSWWRERPFASPASDALHSKVSRKAHDATPAR